MVSQSDIYLGVCESEPVSIEAAWSFINAVEHGGNAFFVGSIRDHNVGRKVQKVEYDIYEAFFLKSLREHYENLLTRYQYPLKCYVQHSKGIVNIGEPSVVVAISSPHRKEAFAACQETIEFIKHHTPVWKKEYYLEGESTGWVQGHALCQQH